MRVNLRDIEEMILKTAKGSLSEVVVVSVLALDKEGCESLVGHVVFGSDTAADPEAFLRGLLDDLPLPQYMCPRVADSTIHSAAEVSHLKSYSNLHDTNVASTKELTRLCLPRRIPIHYVSTAGVAMFAVGDTFDEVSASSTPPPTDGGDGYSASKWASERFLERVNAAFDLPVWIHRPSGIMRPPNEKHNQDALLLSILHFSKRSELCQRLTSSKGHWIVFIENVSRNIVKDVLENNPWTPNGLSYIHQTGDIVIPLDQMKEYIERESEEPLPVVEKLTLTEWAERAELVGLHSSLANVLKNADQIGILQMHIPKLVRKYRN
ncbi:hypothetical protein TCE0_018r05512 [Talaromyces pinophilus]|uniref:Thioester reductase (TE) domain-containing protein n=1 Tax=Talaromyces pinophilus TaxID=128442 RepID=A0A510NVZ4_TALPI|nr:hypothetical protein TCE0_018r05512 [Talaromyces pinophilus]